MKVLITGGLGQLGMELSKQLQVRTDIQEVHCMSRAMLDISSKENVQQVLMQYKPDIVINCAAYTAVDLCEENEERAYQVNTLGPKYLAQMCSHINAKLVHISTDYVFSGNFNGIEEISREGHISLLLDYRLQQASKSKPRRETDEVGPQNVYGKTKLVGEAMVRKYCQKHFIIRTAWLYGEGNNFVRIMLKLAETSREINVVADQFGNPTYAKDLAIAIMNLMQTEYYGTYHGTCEGTCSWYDFAKKIFEIRGIDIKVKPVTSEVFSRPAKRPFYSSLDNFMLKLHGMNTFRTWEEALEDYLSND